MLVSHSPPRGETEQCTDAPCQLMTDLETHGAPDVRSAKVSQRHTCILYHSLITDAFFVCSSSRIDYSSPGTLAGLFSSTTL